MFHWCTCAIFSFPIHHFFWKKNCNATTKPPFSKDMLVVRAWVLLSSPSPVMSWHGQSCVVLRPTRMDAAPPSRRQMDLHSRQWSEGRYLEHEKVESCRWCWVFLNLLACCFLETLNIYLGRIIYIREQIFFSPERSETPSHVHFFVDVDTRLCQIYFPPQGSCDSVFGDWGWWKVQQMPRTLVSLNVMAQALPWEILLKWMPWRVSLESISLEKFLESSDTVDGRNPQANHLRCFYCLCK